MSKKHYARQQYAKYSKPTTTPPEGFTEIFADVDNGGKITVLFSDGSTLPLENYMIKLAQDTMSPTGFVDRSATLSFLVGARMFTISGNPNYAFYNVGVKTIKTTDSVVIGTDVGLYYIYYSALNVLTASLIDPGFSYPMVATVFWNGTTALVMDERHTCSIDTRTHFYLHATIGTRYQSGFDATFSNTTFTISSGVIWDEDIKFSYGDQTTCDIIFKNTGSNFTWFANSSCYYYDSGTHVYYNNGNNPVQVAGNEYVAYWIFATNSITRPIVSLMGQRVDSDIVSSRRNNTYENLNLDGFPFLEKKILYRVIVNGNGEFVEAQDLRGLSNLSGGNYKPLDHGALANRDVIGSHSAISITNTPSGDISSTTVQATVNELDQRTTDFLIKSVSRDDKDEYGNYRTIEFYDANNVLRKSSILSGGTAPLYTTRTIRKYNVSGTLVTTEVYALTYDADQDVVQELLQ